MCEIRKPWNLREEIDDAINLEILIRTWTRPILRPKSIGEMAWEKDRFRLEMYWENGLGEG